MTTVHISPVANIPQFFDNNGVVLANGYVWTFLAGSESHLATTYTSSSGTVPNANPLQLDSSGRPNTEFWLADGTAYHFMVGRTDGDAIFPVWQADNITGVGSSGGGGSGGTPDWINVKDAGAVGDNSHDDTAAFLSAMHAASVIGTCIYVPAGIYKISSTLTNAAAPQCRGIIGDSSTTSIINGPNLTSDAVLFNNPAEGVRFENFRVTGPGISAPVTSRGLALTVDSSGTLQITFQIIMINVICDYFPTAGFYWQLPITSTFLNCIAQNCGTYGFHIDVFTSKYVGGTSTFFSGCYANHVLGSGYFIKSHGYSSFAACAADNCNISYYLQYCNGISIVSCGSEVNTYIDDANPGIVIVLDAVPGATIDTVWAYNLPNVKSLMVKIMNSTNVTVRNVTSYNDIGVLNTYDATVDGGCADIHFLNNANTQRTGATAGQFLVQDGGLRTMNMYQGRISGLNFDVPDTYGNSLYVRNGALVVSADPGLGVVNLFQTLLVDYPTVQINNQGQIYLGAGTGYADTSIQRAGINMLSLSPVKDGLTIIGASNPQLTLNNTGNTQQWAISGDNGDGLAFYDATHGVSPAYLWAVDGVYGQNGVMQLAKGLRVEGGGILFIKDYGNSASGFATFAAAGTVTVTNTLVTANSRILVTIQNVYSGTPGVIYVGTVTPGVGFVLNSTNAAENSLVAYLITEP